MIQVRYLRKMINGVPVMATPAEIDITTAEQLRAVLLAATEQYRTLVVDMTRTRFCDSAAVHALIAARKRVLAKGGELGLVAPADGNVQRGANVRLIRDNVVVHEGKLSTLKRFKDEVGQVQAGQECGMAFENYQDMRVGDVIECYNVEEIRRTL